MLKENFPVWIIGINLRAANGISQEDFLLVRSENIFDATNVVADYCAEQEAQLMDLHTVHELSAWVDQNGHDRQLMGLADTLTEDSPISVIRTPAELERKCLNVISLKGIKPLDLQLGVNEPLTVPADLQVFLFDRPKRDTQSKQDPSPPYQTYAVLDGAKMPRLLTGMLDNSELEYASLFQGEAQAEYGEYAPYLVQLEDGNSFTRKLFTDVEKPIGLWRQNLGIYFRSTAPFSEFRNHMRKFTRVQNAQGEWYFFRFWDPKVMEYYLSNIADVAESTQKFFRDKIASAIVYIEDRATIFTPDASLPAPKGKFVISQKDYEIFCDYKWNDYKKKLTRIFTHEHGNGLDVKADRLEHLADEARSRGFSSEIGIYNYTRAKLFAEQSDQDFEFIFNSKTEGSELERARDIWYEIRDRLEI